MRLEVTRRTDLAIRALLSLERHTGRTKAGVLAEEIGTTPGFLSQVMGPLVQHGWVASDPGPLGGYSLLADLTAVSVLAVVEATEGPTDLGLCVLADRTCEAEGPCVMHRAWSTARAHMLKDLDSFTIADANGA